MGFNTAVFVCVYENDCAVLTSFKVTFATFLTDGNHLTNLMSIGMSRDRKSQSCNSQLMS